MASPELEVLHTVASRLDAAGVPYMLSGSTALGVYATPRMTRDLDVVVELEPADSGRLTQAFAEDFYCESAAVDRAVASRGIVNVIHLEHVIKVDFIVRKDTPYRLLEFARRRRLRIDGQEMWVVSPEDLVLSKLAWARQGGSAVQAADVKELLTSVSDLDWGMTPLDTAPQIQTRYRAMMQAKSPSERVVMACGMLDVARATILAALPDGADERSRRMLLFERMYSRDFDPATARNIVALLRLG